MKLFFDGKPFLRERQASFPIQCFSCCAETEQYNKNKTINKLCLYCAHLHMQHTRVFAHDPTRLTGGLSEAPCGNLPEIDETRCGYEIFRGRRCQAWVLLGAQWLMVEDHPKQNSSETLLIQRPRVWLSEFCWFMFILNESFPMRKKHLSG